MKLQRFKEKKSRIIEDMMSFISYTPNRESDILAFMELYQKSEASHRPKILEQLRHCMDGKEYPNPYERNYQYTSEHVYQMETLLDDYIDKLIGAEGNTQTILSCMQSTKAQIGELNKSTYDSLIDTWRWNEIDKFMSSAAELAGLIQDTSSVEELKM